MHRRTFLRAIGGVGAALAADSALSLPATGHGRQAVGLQLYTVIADLERDFEGTLQSVAKVGYREVETMGSFGRDPREVRAVLDRCGLASPSQHVISSEIYGIVQRNVRGQLPRAETLRQISELTTSDKMPGLVEEGIATAKALGQTNVVWPAVLTPELQSPGALRQVCAALNSAGEACAKAGLAFGYHNHGDELLPIDGRIPYEIMLAETDPRTVKLEMDVYWVVWGKKDPVEYLQRYGARYRQLHLKDSRADGTFAPMGSGVIRFGPVLEAAHRAGVQHYYVEQNSPQDPLQAVRESFTYLRGVL
jgi:sugar phosphate isomerase/epimerase